MKKLWARREIDAPADVLWRLLSEPDEWPTWGPSIKSAALGSETFELGATGTVQTIVGLALPFEITDYTDGQRWAWKVAGVPATDHCVQPMGSSRCRVGFGVPWVAAPYLAVCEVALRRLDALATNQKADQ